MSTGFTYQGYLEQSEVPANGTFDLTFSLWNSAAAGTQVGATQSISGVPVEKGLFTVELNSSGQFGNTAFDGQRRWLEITVNNQILTPRQEITPAPYSLHARGLLVSPTGVLTVSNEIQAATGGFRFPDNTLQTTAAVGDNLGNHTATQNIRLNGNWLSGDGGSEGLLVDQYGNLRGGGADQVNDPFSGSVALGKGARAIGRYSVAIGEGALAEGGGTASFGAHAETGGADSTAIGFANGGISTRTRADGYSLVIGQNISAIAEGGNHNANIAIGTGGFANTLPQTMMLGMGATVPTMTFTSGSGATPGKIGIGTTSPVDDLDLRGSLTWGANASGWLRDDQGGSIELGARGTAVNPVSGGTPYIDFHFGNGQTQEFNMRIINEADERLVFGNATSGAVLYLQGRDVIKPANDGRFIINKTGPGAALEIVGAPQAPANIQCIRSSESERGGIRFLTGATGYWGVGLYASDNSNDLVVRNVQNNLDAIRVQSSNNNVMIGTGLPDQRLSVNGNASKPGGGSWAAYSDRRLKRDILQLNNALDSLLQIRGCTFEYKDPSTIHERSGTQIGVIAQEVEAVFPGWVDDNANGYKTVTFRGFEAVTIEAMRELRSENDELRANNRALESRIQAIEAALGVTVITADSMHNVIHPTGDDSEPKE
ncbi:MAG: tail fiber domain-containing protein [Phycisphaerales bacterium]|nr:tail fiber domain-containing protein [Phycisphaerales bacterium]